MKKGQKIISAFLAVLFLMTNLMPAFSAPEIIKDNEDLKRYYSLEEIQELAIENSRMLQQLDLTKEQARDARAIYNNAHRKIQSQKMGSNIISSAKLNDLKFQMGKLAPEILQQLGTMVDLTSDEGLQQAYDLAGNNQDILIDLNSFSLLRMQYGMLNQANMVSQGFLDAQMDFMRGLGVASHESILKEFRYKKEHAEDMLEDIERAQKDADEQVRLLAALLVFQELKLEKTIELLDKFSNLSLNLADIERLKVDNELSNKVEAQDKGLTAADYQKMAKFARANLDILKGQINDLIGRPINTPLYIKEYRVGGPKTAIPTYEQIVDEVVENTYDFYKLDREIKTLDQELRDTDGSNEKDVKRKEIEKTELTIKDRDLTARNDLKAILADLNEKMRSYQLAELKLQNANQAYQWKQLELECEMISQIMFQGAELEYFNEVVSRMVKSYDYYLTEKELEMAKAGIFMPEDYKLAKMQLSKELN